MTAHHKTPSELIAADLEAHGWTQRDMAHAMKIDYAMMNRLANGRQGITPSMAHRLGAVTGRDPREYWDAQTELWWDLEARPVIPPTPKTRQRKAKGRKA